MLTHFVLRCVCVKSPELCPGFLFWGIGWDRIDKINRIGGLISRQFSEDLMECGGKRLHLIRILWQRRASCLP